MWRKRFSVNDANRAYWLLTSDAQYLAMAASFKNGTPASTIRAALYTNSLAVSIWVATVATWCCIPWLVDSKLWEHSTDNSIFCFHLPGSQRFPFRIVCAPTSMVSLHQNSLGPIQSFELQYRHDPRSRNQRHTCIHGRLHPRYFQLARERYRSGECMYRMHEYRACLPSYQQRIQVYLYRRRMLWFLCSPRR